MLTNKESKSRKLTYEILGIVAICFTISLIVFIFLTSLTTSLIENYLFNNDIILTEDEFFELDKTITQSEIYFYQGEYQKALEITINYLNRIEPNILEKLSQEKF